MSAKKGLISICSCILFALVFCKVTELGLICNKGSVNEGPIRYIRDVLRMMCRYWNLLLFLASSYLDLSCTSVQIHGTDMQQSDVSTSNTEADFPSDW